MSTRTYLGAARQDQSLQIFHLRPKADLDRVARCCAAAHTNSSSSRGLFSVILLSNVSLRLTFGGVAGSIPIAVITLLIVINFLTFLSLLGELIKGEMKMGISSKEVREAKTETCENNKATKHKRFYKRYIAQFIEIAVSMSVSVMAAGSACLTLNVRAASPRSPDRSDKHKQKSLTALNRRSSAWASLRRNFPKPVIHICRTRPFADPAQTGTENQFAFVIARAP